MAFRIAAAARAALGPLIGGLLVSIDWRWIFIMNALIGATAMLAIGVAIFVAIIGSPASSEERLSAFQLGWWAMAAITVLTLLPTFRYLRPASQGAARPA